MNRKGILKNGQTLPKQLACEDAKDITFLLCVNRKGILKNGQTLPKQLACEDAKDITFLLCENWKMPKI